LFARVALSWPCWKEITLPSVSVNFKASSSKRWQESSKRGMAIRCATSGQGATPHRAWLRLQNSHVSSHIPIRQHRTNPTPPDNERSESRMNPTPPDHSDGLLPPHNPSVVGSIPPVLPGEIPGFGSTDCCSFAIQME
jgi:hypothetical protein